MTGIIRVVYMTDGSDSGMVSISIEQHGGHIEAFGTNGIRKAHMHADGDDGVLFIFMLIGYYLSLCVRRKHDIRQNDLRWTGGR